MTMMLKTQDTAAACEPSSKSDAVQVAVRVRPLSTIEASQGSKVCVHVEDANVLLADKCFHFDAAFPPTTQQVYWRKNAKPMLFYACVNIAMLAAMNLMQEIIYTTLVAPIVDQFFSGYNATVFAYGQTGSGKTFTMGNDFGSSAALSNRGVIPRVIETILNEEIRDLLPKISSDKLRQMLSVRGDGDRGIIVHGLQEHTVKSADEALKLLRSGAVSRATAATSMNGKSSRSHAICTISMEYREAADGVKETRFSKFHLVDLAGSERVRRTNTQGARFKEGVSINRGLLALGNVINALSERNRTAHVPYRDSKLTRLLQDSLGGNGKTLMIACISPADVNQEETTNSLRYAARSRKIENQAVINTDRNEVELQRPDISRSSAVSSLEEANRRLTEELRLANAAKYKWKRIAEELSKELQVLKDQASKKPAKKRKKRESYETMETFFSSSDEEEDNIENDPDYVNDEHRSSKRSKVNNSSVTDDVMDEIDEMLETSAASCCACQGKCATKACACKSQSRVCSTECSCHSEKCRNRQHEDTQGDTPRVDHHEGAEFAAPSTPTRQDALQTVVTTTPVIDLMSP